MTLKSTLLTVSVAMISFIQADDRTTGDETLPKFLQQFDTNEDGKIDEEERQAIRDLRTKLRGERRSSIDTDEDGEITRSEIETARETLRLQIEERRLEKFRAIAGEDGLINKQEFATIPATDRLPDFIFEAIFDRLDRDDSGDISAEEFSRPLRRHQQRNSAE